MKARQIIILIIIVSMLVGCAKSEPANSGKLQVYTSFYAMYDFTSKIGGDKIEITNMVPSGTEPHDWEPSATVMAKLEKADVFIYNGAGFEPWATKVVDTLTNKSLNIVEASKGVTLLEGEAHDHEDADHEEADHEEADHEEADHEEADAHTVDPHVWLNPLNVKIEMNNILQALIQADPTNKAYYQTNYDAQVALLDQLDQEYKDTVKTFTHTNIIVAHEAYGYLCDAYGITQMGIEGLNADSEPTPARMAELTDFAKNNQVKVIFFEDLISPKVADALAREVGAKTLVLSPIEGMTEEAIQAGNDYYTVMRANLEALKEALK